MKKYLFFIFIVIARFSQAQSPYDVILPDHEGWNILNENVALKFQVTTKAENARFSIEGIEGLNISFDTLGNFSWTPSFDLVDRVTLVKEFPVIIEAAFPGGKKERKTITFTVHHVNRPPVVEELPPFYVKQSFRNLYQIPSEYVFDPDGDPIVFKSILSQMPEGSTLNSQGQFTWSPSRSQFNSLKTTPAIVEFIVQDQPNKVETSGKLKIAQTQLDLPPEIMVLPNDSSFTIKEDETVNLKIYLSDPNGDDNVRSAGIITSDQRIPSNALKENTPVQYEFTWTPGYNFVDDTQTHIDVEIIIFVLDKTNNRTQKKIPIRVKETENLVEKDGLQFTKYRNNLIAAVMLISQLDDNQKKLNQEYKMARKGKKKRSILNATLGAATGISPLTMEPDQSKIISGVGGTTVLTLGTLEATEVIGRSKESIMEKIRTGIELRNKIQAVGDEFARKYALKSSRRSADFEKDIEKFRAAMNDQKLVLLELDAYQRNRSSVSNKDIKKVFIDFNEEN